MAGFINPRKILNQWGGTAATFFTYTHMSHDLTTGLLPALLPFIRAGLRLSYLQSGLLLSAFTITCGLSQFLGGWLGDRFSRPIVLAAGLSGVGLAGMAVGLSPSYYPMLFIFVMMGILAGAYHPSAVSLISGHFEESMRGKALAIHMVGGSLGFTVGPILGGIIAEMLGWRFAFIILSIPTLVAVPLVLKRFRQQKPTNSSEPSSHVSTTDDAASEPVRARPSLGQALRAIAAVAILAVLIHLVAAASMAFIPLYLVDKHSIAPAYAAMLLGVVRGGGTVGSLFGGWLSDKWGRRNSLLLALIATGPILYLLTIFPFNTALVIIFVLFGVVMYMRQATIQPMLMDNTPQQLRATVFGLYFGLTMEGASLMQPVAGHFMDIFGIIQVFHVIAIISVTLSVVALLFAKWPKLHR